VREFQRWGNLCKSFPESNNGASAVVSSGLQRFAVR
jgi:hypothetical protein